MLSEHIIISEDAQCEWITKYNALIEELEGYLGDDGSTLQDFLLKAGNDDIEDGADFGSGTVAYVTFNADSVEIWGANGANVANIHVDENGIVSDVTDGGDTCTIEHLPTGLYINNNGDTVHIGETAMQVPDAYRIHTDAATSRAEFYDDEIRLRISDGVDTINNLFDATGIHTDGIIESTNTNPLKDRTPDELIRSEQINATYNKSSVTVNIGASLTLTPEAFNNNYEIDLAAGTGSELELNIDYDDILGITGTTIGILINNNTGGNVILVLALTNVNDLGVIYSSAASEWSNVDKELEIEAGVYEVIFRRATNAFSTPNWSGVVTMAWQKLDM